MKATTKSFRSTVLLVFFAAGLFFVSSAFIQADEKDDAVDRAITYLQSQPDSTGKVMALTAAGESSVAVSFLQDFSSSKAIDYAKPILALTAAGKDPRTYPQEDFVIKLKGFANNGQLGDASWINDDMWGILALRSAGVPAEDSVIADSKQFILDNQNEDGGWAWNVGGASDTNDTAAAIQALLEVGVSSSDSVIQEAVSYLKDAQNEDGGFPYDPESEFGTDSESNSDAWVIMAINKLGQDPASWTKGDDTPIAHILSLQDEDGGFWWMEPGTSDFNNKNATADAVIALTGNSFPVKSISSSPEPEETVQVQFRIEGSGEQLCKGTVKAVTAMDVVENASSQCGYDYTIEETESGPYLSRIGLDEAEGDFGWLYRINPSSGLRTGWQPPSAGAAEYELAEGDRVLWSYGEFDWDPLRIVLNEETASYQKQDPIEGIVEVYDSGNWSGVENAKVRMNGNTVNTGGDGSFEFIASEAGAFEMVAEKDGFIRSDIQTIVVSDETKEVDLSAEIIEGEEEIPEEEEIGFSVSPSSLGFGQIAPGENATRQVTLQNTGNKTLSIQAQVQGDPVFNLLQLAGSIWSSFQKNLAVGGQEQVEASLSVPAEFSSFGQKQGTLIFWGTATE